MISQRFWVVNCMKEINRTQKYRNTSQTASSIPDRFQQFLVLFLLERYYIYQVSYAIAQLLFALIEFLVISFIQYQNLFTRYSNGQLLQNCRPYCFIDYSDFLIRNSPCCRHEENPSSFFNFGPIGRPTTLNFRGSQLSLNSRFLGIMLIA